jgi:polysaccharide pyruvyl transferase WcaK-like protein
MHLAIACLGNGVPVGAVVYQDKFEGLFDHFGITPPLVAGDSATDEEVVASFIETVLAQADTLRAAIDKELARVIRLSERNLPDD